MTTKAAKQGPAAKSSKAVKKPDQAAAQKKKRKKRSRIKYYVLGAAVFLSIIIWIGLQPIKGTIHFGVCRTFAELHMKFPQSFFITEMDAFRQSIRIFYTYTHSFGTDRSAMIECVFRPDPNPPGFALEDVKINREDIEPEVIRKFNETIPHILAGEPDLVLPKPAGDDLTALKRR